MRQLAVLAALVLSCASSAYAADEAEGLDLEMTMRVLGDYEDAAAVTRAISEALGRDDSSRRDRRRVIMAEERARPVPSIGFADHRAVLKLDDQLEGEVDDQN